jgi:hypothetical protein
MNQAIFRSTSQALHFAYLIEAYEVSVESIMSKAMRIIMMELGLWNTGEPSTVNFGGLNALEVRAQCSMIRAAVRDRLPAPEAWAVQARYGINEIILADGQRKPVFSRERYDAIMRLGDWLAPSFSNFNPLAVDLLVARAVDKRVVDVTFRQMAENFGLDHSTYAYALKRVRGKLEVLEKMAINRLEPAFMADGLVEPDMNYAQGA